MKIEIISTGEEILTGSVVDTNAAYIAQLCDEKGYIVIRHSTTGDDYSALVDLFMESGKRSDVTIVTGGLGPTSDDRSAEAAATAVGCQLIQNDAAVCSIENYFSGRQGSMSSSDMKQTLLPETADCINNIFGTAPGFKLTIGCSLFFFLPGVPVEMKGMFKTEVIPIIDNLSGYDRKVFLKKSLFLFGLPEAVVNERLNDMAKLYPTIELGFRAAFPVIEIKLKYEIDPADASDEMEIHFNQAVNWVEQQVGDYIFSDVSGKIEVVVGRLLVEKKKTLAVAESCTGGLIGHKLTEAAGSSDYFLTSCVTYANSSKIDILGVDPKTIEVFGAVSEETVKEMAEGVRKISGADYAVATSGIAGPDGGSPDKPVGSVFIGLADENETKAFEFRSPFADRNKNKIIFYIKTLDLLRRLLLS